LNPTRQDISSKTFAPHARPLQWKRKIFHLINGSIGFWLYTFSGLSEFSVLLILGTCALFALMFDLVRIQYPAFNAWSCKRLTSVMRNSENGQLTSVTKGLSATWIVLIICPRPVDLLVIQFATYCDTVGGIVGSLWGKRHLNKHATLEGSFAVFISGSLITFLTLIFLIPEFDLGIWWLVLFSFLSGLIALLAEGLFPDWDDNATIPLISGPALYGLFYLFGI
jgi:dolichol kinase